MTDIDIQNIMTEYGKKIGKKFNLRVIALIDPYLKNPYEGLNTVYAPGMMHLTTESLSELMREFEFETERFIKGIIIKDESKVPRTIYVSTDTRRIFIRNIRIPNKRYQLALPNERADIPKELVYYLGISIIKNLLNVGRESPEEKPQVIFDELDNMVNDMKRVL